MAELMFWVLCTSVVWTYVGYPAAIGVRSVIRPRPWRRRPIELPVSVVLAVRNEGARLEKRLTNLLEAEYPAELLEIVVIGNGCVDDSVEVARELSGRDARIRVLTSPGSRGKAGALTAGVAEASGDILVFADARQSFAPSAIRSLVAGFADPQVGAVTGRLVVERADRPGLHGVNLYWGMETRLRIAESRTGSVVGATGAIYAMRRELFQQLPDGLILDDVYLPLHVVQQGYRVVMAPEAVAVDTPAESARAEYRRKLRTLVGNIQLVRLAPWLLSPWRNPIFGRFISHKLLRVATPICLLAMLGIAMFLPGAIYQTFAVGFVAVVVLGCLGLWLRLPGFALPSAFVLVHAAGLSALFRSTRDAAHVWK